MGSEQSYPQNTKKEMKKTLREQILAAISEQPMTAKDVAEYLGANSGSVGGLLSKLNKDNTVIMSHPNGDTKAGVYSLAAPAPYKPQHDALSELDAVLLAESIAEPMAPEQIDGEEAPRKLYGTPWFKFQKDWTAYIMKHPEIAAEFIHQVTYYMDHGQFDNPGQNLGYLEFIQPKLDENLAEIMAKSKGGKNSSKSKEK